MGLFDRRSKEDRFWSWFQENSQRLLHFEDDQEATFDALAAALQRVCKGLTFEFGPTKDGRREFIVSADGIQERFPAVRRLVEAAPALSEWAVIPFRPPKSLDLEIEFGDLRLTAADLWFVATPEGDRTALSLFVSGLDDDNREPMTGAVFILLDNALGEYAVETQVGSIELAPLPDDPASHGFRPFREIREVFDTVVH